MGRLPWKQCEVMIVKYFSINYIVPRFHNTYLSVETSGRLGGGENLSMP